MRKTMKRNRTVFSLITGLLLLAMATTVRAQQDPMYSQYMMNGMVLNPAYAGTHGVTSITALTRLQWRGVSGAPVTHTLSAHTPIGQNVSVGANFVHDRIGSVTRNGFTGVYAYSVPVAGVGTLSMGLQAGLMTYNTDLLSAYHDNDPLNNSPETQMKPDFGTGLYFYNDKLFLGLSAPSLFRAGFAYNRDSEGPTEFVELENHLFGYGGYLFSLNETWKMHPTVLVKYVKDAPLQADINGSFIYNDFLWMGLSYRTLDGFTVLGQLVLHKQDLRIGAAYDFPHTELGAGQFGTFEIMLNYRFSFDKTATITPRYF